MNTSQPKVSVEFVDVQKQCGSSDCGVYAIAYATALSLHAYTWSGSRYSSLLPNRDEETSFQNVEGEETYNVSIVKEKLECESDRGQSHPIYIYIVVAGCRKWEI